MIPLTLNLRNFLSYRGSVTIDFRPLTVACLSGENGAGKSALLDAITWAIWGKSRARSDNDLISLGEEEMEVTFTFRMGAREYRVMRRRSKSKPTLEFDTRALGSENWLPIGGDSIRDTEARIVDELRLDYDTFVNSALLQQGQADRFTRNQPSERKRILGEILNLAVYDQLAKEARDETRRAREQMDRVQERISR
ncbi:MAG TPA: AAA family ATPase, partial [Thermomicrobiales bacterium]|nr:AAA family ATPase [Thermomicrobiales bacterium]